MATEKGDCFMALFSMITAFKSLDYNIPEQICCTFHRSIAGISNTVASVADGGENWKIPDRI